MLVDDSNKLYGFLWIYHVLNVQKHTVRVRRFIDFQSNTSSALELS